MRLFIAIELENEIMEYIYKKQQLIQSYSLRGNFTRKENLHLTLRFLGETDPKRVGQIRKALDATAEVLKPFSLQLGNLGYFPRKDRKIIWIGIQKGKEKLETVFLKLEENLEKQGFSRETRTFRPHITIGREVKLRTSFEEILEQAEMKLKRIEVCRISLMESKRMNGVLKYIPIYQAGLGKK
jgi:2'-5' RNA ligase